MRALGRLLDNVGVLEKDVIDAEIIAITMGADGQEVLSQGFRPLQGSPDHSWQEK